MNKAISYLLPAQRTSVAFEDSRPRKWRIWVMHSTGLVAVSIALTSCGGSGSQSKLQSAAQFFVETNPQAPLIMPGSSQQLLITVLPVLFSYWNGTVDVTIT